MYMYKQNCWSKVDSDERVMYTPKTAENNPEDFDLLVKECIVHAKCTKRKKKETLKL